MPKLSTTVVGDPAAPILHIIVIHGQPPLSPPPQTTSERRRLLSPVEVADHLGITSRAVRKLLDARKLRGSKVGRVWRVRADDLDAFVDVNGST